MKPVLLIALVAVAMIGVMVPSSFAEETVEVPFIFEIRENDWTTGGIGTGNSVFLIITGDLQDNGFTKFTINGLFHASFPLTLEEQMHLTEGNTENWINFDWQYRSGEEYTLTATNGDYSTSVTWIPLSTDTKNSDNSITEIVNPSITENSKIKIQGEIYPIIREGIQKSYSYTVEVVGDLEFNDAINDVGGWLKTCYGDITCSNPDKSFLITEDSRTQNFLRSYDYVWDNEQYRFDLCLQSGLHSICSEDGKPKIIPIVFQYGNEIGLLNVYPEYIEKEQHILDESFEKIHTRDIHIKDIFPGKMKDRWFVELEICSGERALSKPSLTIYSDIETVPHVLNKNINELSCAKIDTQVKAKDPETIIFEFEEATLNNSDELEELKKELETLKEIIKEEQSVPVVEEQSVPVVEEQSVPVVEEQSVPVVEEKGGGCLIATATYGSELAPQVQQLRELRDNQLLQTESGAAFMTTFNDIYYSFSPIIADYERENPYFKEAVKIAITPMLSSLSLMENANSESEVISLGLSVIMLNLGMYLGVPAVVIVGIKKRF